MKESGQLYLKTLWELSQGGRRVRHVDVAKALGYSRPSVTIAIKKLEKEGLVFFDEELGIQLTQSGEAEAKAISQRHDVLSSFLRWLGADEALAQENAGPIAQAMTDELFALIQGRTERA